MRPVYHKACGEQLGWYRGPRTSGFPGFVVPTRDYTRLDGTSPGRWDLDEVGYMFNEKCEHCGRYIGPMEMEIRQPRSVADLTFHVEQTHDS